MAGEIGKEPRKSGFPEDRVRKMLQEGRSQLTASFVALRYRFYSVINVWQYQFLLSFLSQSSPCPGRAVSSHCLPHDLLVQEWGIEEGFFP